MCLMHRQLFTQQVQYTVAGSVIYEDLMLVFLMKFYLEELVLLCQAQEVSRL